MKRAGDKRHRTSQGRRGATPGSRRGARSVSGDRIEIPGRERILQILDEAGAPMRAAEIARQAGLTSDTAREAFNRRLAAMERDGQIAMTRAGYGVAASMELKPGRVVGHPDGYAFVVPDDVSGDVFLPARQARKVLHGDRVLVRVAGQDRRGRPEGRVVQVLERANQEIVGRYFSESGVGFVVPDNRRINQDVLIPTETSGAAKDGQIVIARVVHQPDQHRQPVGEIIEVLGDHMAPGMEIDIAIRAFELPHEWPEDALQEAGDIDTALPADEVARRIDLRALPFVTIDGEDARDFDDAVYCDKHGNGFRLFVAIADVGQYVRPGMALDDEAHRRGNSVYFPDNVIPMLPEKLSNGVCSLKPDEDRLVLVSELAFDGRGEIARAEFFEATIRSRARLTYTQVAGVLSGSTPPPDSPAARMRPQIGDLYALFKKLRTRREERGALDIDTIEPRIVFDAKRKIASIDPVRRNDAHRMIEEFMVAANQAAAWFLIGERQPTLFRVHERPDIEKVDSLRLLLGEMKLKLGGGFEPPPTAFARLLDQVRGKPHAHLIETVVLRTMKLAVYSPENIGHFGLAFEAYVHFTSPIRRYPDLIVHRGIKQLLNGESFEPYPYADADLSTIGEHSSMTERRADEATRDAINWLRCEYMLDKVGQRFRGTVTGVTSFGLFVELDDVFVEGLVHVTTLGRDYFKFDAVGHRLIGERSKRTFQIGQRIEVYVSRVSLDDRQIDLDLA